MECTLCTDDGGVHLQNLVDKRDKALTNMSSMDWSDRHMIGKILNLSGACMKSPDCIQTNFQNIPFIRQIEIMDTLDRFPAGPLRRKKLADISKRNDEINGEGCILM